MPAGGLPTGVKEAGQRVDFRAEQFSLLIATKGYRVWWSRAAICPCRNNTETDQPKTTCQLCHGTGFFKFLPEIGLDKYPVDSFGNAIQINAAKNAVLIQLNITQASKDPQILERFGTWIFGTVRVTSEWCNKLSYRDYLTLADAIMAWSQLIEYQGGETIPVTGGYKQDGPRYKIVQCNLLRSVDQVYTEGEHYFVNESGGITWLLPAASRPSTGTLLSIHYYFNPIYRVLDHVYAYRDSLIAKKTGAATLAEQVKKLPTHAMAKLDFLLEDDS
jgi:hypothetical protein